MLVIVLFNSLKVTCIMNLTGNISADMHQLFKSVVNNGDFHVDIQAFDGMGEGFVGDVLFVTITEKQTNEEQYFIIKQQRCLNGKALNYTDTPFDNEIYFYSTIWPTLQQFHQESTQTSLEMVPKCVGTFNGGLKKIALENLSVKNFVTYDKRKPFDDDHLMLIMETYGKFHAVSMAFKARNVGEYNTLIEPLRRPDITVYKEDNFCGKYLRFVFRQVQDFFDRDLGLVERLKFYETSGINLLNNCLSDGTSNGVLLHGDCWSNNMMFKYDVSMNFPQLSFSFFKMGIFYWKKPLVQLSTNI